METLPDATPPIGKVPAIQHNQYSFLTSYSICMSFRILGDLYQLDIVYFITGRAISNRLGLTAP